MQKSALALVSTAGVLTAFAAVAGPKEAPAPAPVPYFVANCFNCHGTDGKTHGAIPALAGRERAVLEETLKAYKAGTKTATIMQQLAKGYTDEEIAEAANYFARQK